MNIGNSKNYLGIINLIADNTICWIEVSQTSFDFILKTKPQVAKSQKHIQTPKKVKRLTRGANAKTGNERLSILVQS